jgi:hypothetical protein
VLAMWFRRDNDEKYPKSGGSDPRLYRLLDEHPDAVFFVPPALTPDTLNYLSVDSGGPDAAFERRFRSNTSD